MLRATVLLSLALPGPAFAQDTTHTWNFRIAPYFFAPSLAGNVVVHGHEAPVSISASEILDHLKFGALAFIDVARGKWGVGLDGMYVKVGDSRDRPPVLDMDLKQGVYTLIITRRVTSVVSLYAGARAMAIRPNVEFGGPIGLQIERSKSWLGPVVGTRLAVPTGNWVFSAAADFGGFGINSYTTAEVWPVVTYRVFQHARVAAGYRALYNNFEDGTGDHRFRYDLTMKGPAIGLVFDFGVSKSASERAASSSN